MIEFYLAHIQSINIFILINYNYKIIQIIRINEDKCKIKI